MKSCPFCGATIEDSARFCLTCMSSLDEKHVWRAPRRHYTRWQACLAAVSAVAAVIGAVLLWPDKPSSIPADTTSTSASESDLPDMPVGTSTTGSSSIGTSTAHRTKGTTTSAEKVTGTSTNGAPSTTSKATTQTTSKATTQTTTAPDNFVPDYRPGHANTVGNAMQITLNRNRGLITKQDQWLYYSHGGGLNKIRIDGTGQQTIDKRPFTVDHLNVVGDWLYFNQSGRIYRMRTDGSRVECLYDDRPNSVYQIYITENYGYFSSDNGVHRLDLKTRQVKTINTEITNHGLRYLSEEKDILIGLTKRRDINGFEISQYSLSSLNALQWEIWSETYSESPWDCLVAGDTLFYTTPLNIYTADLRSSAPAGEFMFKQQRQNAINIFCYSTYKGGVLSIEGPYGSPVDTELYFMDGTTGSIEAELTESGSSLTTLYCFDDDYVYYFKDNQLYRANGDCSNPVQLTK